MFGVVVCPSCGGNLGVVEPAYAHALATLKPPREGAAAISSGFAGFAPGTALGPLLDALGLHRVCCRMHILAHVTLADVFGPALAGPDSETSAPEPARQRGVRARPAARRTFFFALACRRGVCEN